MKTSAFLATAAVIASTAYAQDDLRDEQSQVCGFSLQADNQDIVRTNDWKIAQTNGDSSLQPAQFWITAQEFGRLYGGNGERCGFDPYLECDSDDQDVDDNDDDDNNTTSTNSAQPQGFAISEDGTLSFRGESSFYLCSRGAFVEIDNDDDGDNDIDLNEDDLQDFPFVYPPLNTTDDQRNYENCTMATLVASECQGGQEGQGGYTLAPTAALASSTAAAGSSSATASGSRSADTQQNAGSRTVKGSKGVVVGGVVGIAALGFALFN